MIPRAARRRLAGALALASCVLALAACDESLLVVSPGAVDGARVVAVTPTQLLAQFGVALDTPIRVRVLDDAGRPVRSAAVHYDVMVGAGIFSADSTLTNDQGYTEVTFRPLTAGTVIVGARVNRITGPQEVQFSILVLTDPTIATSFQKMSGDNQTGVVGSPLPAPLVVRLLNGDGFPVANVSVLFALQTAKADSAGVSLDRGGPFAGQVVVVSDSSGFARAYGRPGTEAGAYSFTATALVEMNGVKQSQTLTFNATAIPSSKAAVLIPIAGADQHAVLDTLHAREDTVNFRGRDPQPMVVQAVDKFGNPVGGVALTWFVSDGSGRLDSFITFTDANGIAINRISGISEGHNVVVVFAPGAAKTAEFVIEVELYEPPSDESGGGGGGG